nr:hypothetical protein [Tanacetum cinerariifolium]
MTEQKGGKCHIVIQVEKNDGAMDRRYAGRHGGELPQGMPAGMALNYRKIDWSSDQTQVTKGQKVGDPDPGRAQPTKLGRGPVRCSPPSQVVVDMLPVIYLPRHHPVLSTIRNYNSRRSIIIDITAPSNEGLRRLDTGGKCHTTVIQVEKNDGAMDRRYAGRHGGELPQGMPAGMALNYRKHLCSKFVQDLPEDIIPALHIDEVRTRETAYRMGSYRNKPWLATVCRFLALGWHLEEIYMTWAHLEKKRTRLRLYTNIKIIHSESGDSVATIKRRRHDSYGDSARDSATASGRDRHKVDLEPSMWRRRQ